MASGWNNGNLLVDPGASADSFIKTLQNGTSRATFGYQQSSSSGKVSFGDFGTNDTIIFDATGGKYKGYNTSTAPAAGFIGEQIRSVIASGSSVALSNSAFATVTSISLTAGIWDATGLITYTGSTTGTLFSATVASTAGAFGVNGDNTVYFPYPPTSVDLTLTVPVFRFSLAGTTTVFLTAFSFFSAGTPRAYGRLSATRVG